MAKEPSSRLSYNTSSKQTRWAKIQDKIHQYSRSVNSSKVDNGHNNDIRHEIQNNAKNTLSNINTSPYSERTTSIPRSIIDTPSTTSLTKTYSPESLPPKVEPFHNKNLKSSRKTSINTKCCYCDEMLSSKLSTEKIIELNCGDVCHEECLFLLLSSSSDSKDSYSIFPKCETCNKQAIPLDESIIDSMISRFLISSSSSNINTSHPNSDSFIISSNYQLPPNQQFLSPLTTPTFEQQHQFSDHKYQSMSLSNKKNSKDLSIYIPEKPYIPHKHRKTSSKSRGSSISAISSIVSSVPKTPDEHDNFISSPRIPLALSRSEYVSNLLLNLRKNYNSNFKESEIDSLGLLRLVDNLRISETGENFKEFIVYLFQKSIILVNQSYSDLISYKIPKIPQIKTPNSSLLKISLLEDKTLYITHRSDKVLQKWVAGLCDYDFIFSSDDLSSTLQLKNNDLITSVNSNSSNEEQYIREEEDIDDQVTIPVSLSPMKTPNNYQTQTPIVEEESLQKFVKTNNLILIIDHMKSLNDENLIVLKNIAKALSTKFEEFNLINSIDFTKVSNYGDVNKIEKIGKDDKILENVTITQSIKDLMKESKDYSLLIITNSNIISNDLSQLPISNQLVISVQNYGINIKNNNELPQNDNLLKVNSWDRIMEVLISRLDLEFNGLSDDEFDSDLDSDFDSDAFEETEEAETNQGEVIKTTTRWSGLFKDIDEALMDTLK